MREENESFPNKIDFHNTAFYGQAPVPAYYPSDLTHFISAPLDSNSVPIGLDLYTDEISEPDKMQQNHLFNGMNLQKYLLRTVLTSANILNRTALRLAQYEAPKSKLQLLQAFRNSI